MAAFRFSRRAEADLLSTGLYTLHTWGEVQTARYMNELEACCHMLAANPNLGRVCDHVLPGLRRMEHERHVVFYLQGAGILISRILHQRILPERHAIDDEEDES